MDHKTEINESVGDELRAIIEEAYGWIAHAQPRRRDRSAVDGRWCPRQILGHLIDSAANNHQRFVRAPGKIDFVFEGYDQDEWVSLQKYHEVTWSELVELWYYYNRHLARVMDAVPHEVRTAEKTHNFDRIGWTPVRADQSLPLEHLMKDYNRHLEHHLGQLRTLLSAE